MLIPHQQLSVEALQSLIEDVVTRDGTDYGEIETALHIKAGQVRKQLDQGILVIIFNDKDGSVDIILKECLPPDLL